MADKQITELTEATVLNSTDALVIGRGTQALKLLGSTLIQYISRNVVSVTVTTLPEGSQATASFDPNTGVLSLGIPKGDTGDAGTLATPTVAGIMKLFEESGQNTDGTMTQKAITDAIAEAIEPFVSYASEQSLTDAQKQQARKNIQAGGTNPNLLKNPWFRVKSPSFNSGLDLWTKNADATITQNSDGTITITGSNITTGVLYCVLDTSYLDNSETYTFSVWVTAINGTANASVRFKNALALTVGINAITYNTLASSNIIYSLLTLNGSITIKAVKLELGEVSTLANDVPPDDNLEYLRANWPAPISNRNLIDNSWFTVNQRGVTSASVTSTVATQLDRWKFWASSSATLTANANGIAITNNSASTSISQRFDSDFNTMLNGKLITCSVMLQNGTVYSYTFTRVNATNQNKEVTSNIVLSMSAAGAFEVGLLNGASLSIRACKLELGPISTLANDVAPDYGEELRKCQRYLFVLDSIGNTQPVGIGFMTSTTECIMRCPLFTPLRTTNPTVTYDGAWQFRPFTSGGSGASTSITAIGFGSLGGTNEITLNLTTSGQTIGTAGYVRNTSTRSKIYISAEL